MREQMGDGDVGLVRTVERRQVRAYGGVNGQPSFLVQQHGGCGGCDDLRKRGQVKDRLRPGGLPGLIGVGAVAGKLVHGAVPAYRDGGAWESPSTDIGLHQGIHARECAPGIGRR